MWFRTSKNNLFSFNFLFWNVHNQKNNTTHFNNPFLSDSRSLLGLTWDWLLAQPTCYYWFCLQHEITDNLQTSTSTMTNRFEYSKYSGQTVQNCTKWPDCTELYNIFYLVFVVTDWWIESTLVILTFNSDILYSCN